MKKYRSVQIFDVSSVTPSAAKIGYQWLLVVILFHLGFIFGLSWLILAFMLAYLGSILVYLGSMLAILPPSWPNLVPTWPHLASTCPDLARF